MGGKEWEELYYHNRELSQAAGAEKPSEESKKRKPFWALNAAWDRSEKFYHGAGKEYFLGRTLKTVWNCGKNIFKTPLAALAKALQRLENPHQGWHLVSQLVVASPLSSQWAAASMARRFCKRCVWPYLDPWDVVRLCTSSSVRNVPGKCGPHGKLFFLPH